MSDKKLTFAFVLDETSFGKVKRALDELIGKSKELAKTLSGVSLPGARGGFMGGGTVGRPGGAAATIGQNGGNVQTQLGKVILDNAQAFKSMANLGSASLKGLTDALKTNVDRQKREINTLQSALQGLSQTYARMGSARVGSGAGGAWGGGGRPPGGPASGGGGGGWAGVPSSGWGGAGSGGNPWTSQGPSGPAGPGGSSGGGSGGGGWFGANGPPGSNNPWLNWALGKSTGAQVARGAGAVGAGLALGYGVTQLFQAGNNYQLDVNAQRGQTVMPSWNRFRKGDTSELTALQYISRQSPEARQRILQSVGSTEADFSDVVGGFGGLKGGDFAGASAAGMDNKKYQRYQEMLAKVQSTMGYADTFGRGNEYVNESRGDRMALSRTGMGGFYFDKKTGQFKDSYSRTAQALESGAWTSGEYVGALTQARHLGGQPFAREFGWSIMGANASGYSGVGDLLGNAARGRGGLPGARSLAEGALGGGIATAAGIGLGNSLFGYDPRSGPGIDGSGALSAIQGGMSFNGGPADFNAVARAQLAMGAGDKLFGGFDGYQQGRNTISAIAAMPGGTTYAQDSLAGRTSFKELLELARGGTSARSRAYGYGKDEAQSQLQGVGESLFDRFVDQGGQDNVSKAVRSFRGSGKDLTKFMKTASKADREAMGVYMADEMGMDTEAGLGLADMFAGVDDKRELKRGKLPFGSVDDMEKKQREQNVIELKKQQDALNGVVKGIVDAIKGLSGGVDNTKGFGMLQGNVATLVDGFNRLSVATENLIGRMGGSTTLQTLGNDKGSPRTKAGAKTDVRDAKAGGF